MFWLDNRNRISRAVFQDGVRALDSSEAARLEGGAQTVRGEFDPASEELRTVVAEGNVQLRGLLIEVNPATGKATSVERITKVLDGVVHGRGD